MPYCLDLKVIYHKKIISYCFMLYKFLKINFLKIILQSLHCPGVTHNNVQFCFYRSCDRHDEAVTISQDDPFHGSVFFLHWLLMLQTGFQIICIDRLIIHRSVVAIHETSPSASNTYCWHWIQTGFHQVSGFFSGYNTAANYSILTVNELLQV